MKCERNFVKNKKICERDIRNLKKKKKICESDMRNFKQKKKYKKKKL